MSFLINFISFLYSPVLNLDSMSICSNIFLLAFLFKPNIKAVVLGSVIIACNIWALFIDLKLGLQFFTEAINSLSGKLSQTPILDTTDMMNDTYYDYVYNTLFKMGTGRGDIIKTRTGVPITIYKGLVPYTSKDRVELWIHPVSDVEFITNYRVVKMKLTKNAPTLDLFLRSLNFYNAREWG